MLILRGLRHIIIPKKYYFCDKLGFDTASILYNNFDIGEFTKGGPSI